MHQKLYLLSALFLSFASLEIAHSGSVILSWNASLTPTVTGYNVYYGTHSGNYPYKIDAGNSTNVMIPGLNPGVTYYFAATAYDAYGDESTFSPEVDFIVSGVITI